MKRIALLLLVALIAGCAYANAPARWPERGPFVSVKNETNVAMSVDAQDGAGRVLRIIALIPPGQSRCARWPFVDNVGVLIARTGTDRREVRAEFFPWSGQAWTWRPGANTDPEKREGWCS